MQRRGELFVKWVVTRNGRAWPEYLEQQLGFLWSGKGNKQARLARQV